MKIEDVKALIRKNIAQLTPYSTARDEYQGELGVFLDANENPYENGCNRYPTPHQWELKELIGKKKGIAAENIFLGNGSDEAIDLVFRIFCNPGKDKAVAIAPSYGMYKVAASINDVELKEVLLNEDFSLPVEKLIMEGKDAKVMFLCSPNNPTGNSFPVNEILSIAACFKGILVIDEAYIDFAEQESFVGAIANYPNIVVLQTLSKAWGMAGLRIGIAVADAEIIKVMSMVKYPYNLNVAGMEIAKTLLEKGVESQLEEMIQQREMLMEKLSQMECVVQVYPSDANFILAKFQDANAMYDYLIGLGIIARNRTNVPLCKNCLRISVGTPAENAALLDALEGYGAEKAPALEIAPAGRRAAISRKTKETDIQLVLNLDGKEASVIDTGLKFLDHMLYQIVHHAGVSLSVTCKGDLEVDEHHTMEDIAIVLGEAIYQALGSKRGIERYGFALPMDECRALVLLDFGGRADFVWNVNFTREMVGDVPTEMFKHFFKSLCIAMKANLQIEAKGENNHHLIEGVYKAFARAMKMAIKRDVFKYDLPSSKGII